MPFESSLADDVCLQETLGEDLEKLTRMGHGVGEGWEVVPYDEYKTPGYSSAHKASKRRKKAK